MPHSWSSQILFPLLGGLHQEAGRQHGGVLSQRGEMSPGRLQRPLGLHAGRDHNHPPGGQAGPGGEEQEQINPVITSLLCYLVSLALS